MDKGDYPMTVYGKPKTDYYDLADVGTRLIALIIDGFILSLITGLLFWGGREAGGFAGFLVGVGYHWYFLTQQDGQTPGKRIMNIRVVRVDGQPIDATTVVVRYVGYFVNSFLFGLGWLWAFWDKDHQGFHDKLANTVVISV
jgi:uncharacterized RDD family membrane protein YckC